MVLGERRFCRELPIKADYVGRTVDVVDSEWIEVNWEGPSGRVLLNTRAEDE
jgi:pyrimidine operon attenuation protein/uracil phosphoribosyltransferase